MAKYKTLRKEGFAIVVTDSIRDLTCFSKSEMDSSGMGYSDDIVKTVP
jgi:hypothetical protein